MLRDWLENHIDRPYPTDEEKTELETETGLTSAQISTWLANARRRNKAFKPKGRRGSGSIPRQSSSDAVDIPNNATPWREVCTSILIVSASC